MAQIQDLRPKIVKIDLGGKERVIKFDLNAYAELENRFGSVEKAMNILQEGSLVGLRTILWAGLIHDEAVIDPRTGEPTSYNVTPFMVGSWIEPTEMQSVSIKLSEAILATLPANQRAEAEKELEKLSASLVQEPVSSTEEQATTDVTLETEKNV
jgi:hypothetical protein